MSSDYVQLSRWSRWDRIVEILLEGYAEYERQRYEDFAHARARALTQALKRRRSRGNK